MSLCLYVQVFSNSTLVEILDDLCVRFIVNLPIEELGSVERICFQIEEAQWYYEDFVRGHNMALPTLNLRSFAAKIFQHCPSLQEWKDQHEEALNRFIAYKTRVPVRGAILLNHDLDQCVLVRGMKSSASWSFPRGKINQDEDDVVCAVREVREETGFDAENMINPEWMIETTMRGQNMRLYIIPGVPIDTDFAPRTRGEIGTIQWHRLSDLPTYSSKKKSNAEAPKMGKFYMVAPFLPALRKWIQNEGAQWQATQGQYKSAAAPSPTDDEQNDVETPSVETKFASHEASKPSVYEDSSASLRSLLGIHAESVPDPVANQADAAAKLKSLLSIGSSSDSAHSSLATNGQILLSLLQSGPSNKQAEPRPPEPTRNAPPVTQPPMTPTRAPANPSPHSTLLPRKGSMRKPLSPLYDLTPSQAHTSYSPTSIFTKPPPAAPDFSQAQTTSNTGPYTVAPQPNALLASLQAQAKPTTMTDQASALLKTLTSGSSPQQPPTQKQQPSPLDVFFNSTQKPQDTQQKLSLLSILKGETESAPSASLPPSQILHSVVPQVQPPQLAPKTAAAAVATTSPVTKSPPTSRDQNQRAPMSPPRGPRHPRGIRNGNYPKPAQVTHGTRSGPITSSKGTHALPPPPDHQQHRQPHQPAPPSLQQQPKRFTPPLEPYLHTSVNGVSLSLNGTSPVAGKEAMFDRRETANHQQQQTLLALFKKPSLAALKPEPVAASAEVRERVNVGDSVMGSVSGVGSGSVGPGSLPASAQTSPRGSVTGATARLVAAVRKVQGRNLTSPKAEKGVAPGVGLSRTGSEVGSVTGASVAGGSAVGSTAGATSPRTSEVPGGAVSFAKDAFLMKYLESVAKGAGK
ncbi:hypothetical protein BDZ91DRAFT_233035 [Kalaharituber pfeilii]|nr:hypothetical protein BDZ91DRAFT_233035 [Kalaharituber pfeilii]